MRVLVDACKSFPGRLSGFAISERDHMSSLDLIPASVSDYRRLAKRRLPRTLFDYLDGGASDEISLKANEADLKRVRFEQRVMRDVSKIDTATTLFGESLRMPLVLAPVGLAGMMARRGELQAKSAADSAGIPFCLSTVGICGMDEVATVSDRPFWFQLYMLRDRGVVSDLLEQAWIKGVRTLVFTVDLAVLGTRDRDIRNGLAGGVGALGRFRAGLLDYLLHPHWLWSVGVKGTPHVFGNLAQYVPKATSPADFRQWVANQFDASVTWKDIEWLRSIWRGKLVLKGILNVDDAHSACSAGADGFVVSNHGGRQLDGVASTISVLPGIADAVGASTVLLVDGGIRNGHDVMKAVAMGAHAVMVGRPWVYAVAAAGERGLDLMLSRFKADMVTALGLTGVTSIANVDRTILSSGPW